MTLAAAARMPRGHDAFAALRSQSCRAYQATSQQKPTDGKYKYRSVNTFEAIQRAFSTGAMVMPIHKMQKAAAGARLRK